MPNPTRSAALRERLVARHGIVVSPAPEGIGFMATSNVYDAYCGTTHAEAIDHCLDAIGAPHDSTPEATPNLGASWSTLVPATGMAALRDLLQQWRDEDMLGADCDVMQTAAEWRADELEAVLDAEYEAGGENALGGFPVKEGRALDKALDALAFDACGGAEDEEIQEHKTKIRECVRNIVAAVASSDNTAARAVGVEEGRAQLSEDHEMANGCLDMIREDLEAFGVTMSGTPPMMYNDAMRHSWRLAKQHGRAETGRLDALATDIVTWQRATFPASTVSSCVTHLAREAEELLVDPHDTEELADVFLLVCAVADKMGVSLVDVAAAKLAKNKARTWGVPDSDGVVEHIDAAITGGPSDELR
jgi:hypothetical protein